MKIWVLRREVVTSYLLAPPSLLQALLLCRKAVMHAKEEAERVRKAISTLSRLIAFGDALDIRRTPNPLPATVSAQLRAARTSVGPSQHASIRRQHIVTGFTAWDRCLPGPRVVLRSFRGSLTCPSSMCKTSAAK